MADDEKKVIIEKPSDIAQKKKKQWMMLGLGVVAGVFILVLLGAPEKREPRKRAPKAEAIEFAKLTETDWVAQAQIELKQARDAMQNVNDENEKLRNTINNQQKSLTKLTEAVEKSSREIRSIRGENERTLKEATRLIDEAKLEQEKLTLSARDAANNQRTGRSTRRPQVLGQGGAVPPPRFGEDGKRIAPPTVVREVAPRGAGGNASSGPDGGVPAPRNWDTGEPLIIAGVKAEKVDVIADFNSRKGPNVGSRVEYEENEYAGFLPAGSFAEATVLHGVEAGASEYTRNNPQPIIVRISSHAVTPGDSKYDLKSCFGIGSGYGDLSTERARIRITRLSCLDAKRGFVLEAAVDAFLVDSDGTEGLRGKVVRRNGQILAKGLLAGFAEGIAKIAGTAAEASSQTLTTAGGVAGVVETDIDAGGLARAGAFGGASNAAEIISEYYLNEAQQIFPAIQIPTGRKVTVTFQKGTALKWESYKGVFKKQVEPQ